MFNLCLLQLLFCLLGRCKLLLKLHHGLLLQLILVAQLFEGCIHALFAEVEFIFKRLFLLDENLVAFCHEMLLVHNFYLIHSLPEKLRLIMDSIGIVLESGDLSRYDNWHFGIGFEQLWLQLQSFLYQVLNR